MTTLQEALAENASLRSELDEMRAMFRQANDARDEQACACNELGAALSVAQAEISKLRPEFVKAGSQELMKIQYVRRVRRHGPTTLRVLIDPETPAEELGELAKSVNRILVLRGEGFPDNLLIHREPGQLPKGYELNEGEDCDGEAPDAAGVGGCLPTNYWPIYHWELPQDDDAGRSFRDKAQAIDDAWDDATDPWRLLADRISHRIYDMWTSETEPEDIRDLVLELFSEEDVGELVIHAGGPPAHDELGKGLAAVRLLREQRDQLQAESTNLRRQLTIQREGNERRNRQLDALGVVWCSGGCEGGMARYEPSREVTADMVVELVINADRAATWYVNHAGKSAVPIGSDAILERRRVVWDNAIASLRKTFGERFGSQT